MKFKAKPKLTPERLKQRINKLNGHKPSMRTFTMKVNCLPIIFDSDGLVSLIGEINYIASPLVNYKTEFHCDADFY